jgi:hypothetical protein
MPLGALSTIEDALAVTAELTLRKYVVRACAGPTEISSARTHAHPSKAARSVPRPLGT